MSKKQKLLQLSFPYLKRALLDLRDVFANESKQKKEIRGKRILIFNWRDTKHRYAGGAEVYIHELAKRWVKNGDQVTLFCGSDGKSKRNEVIDGITIIRRGGFYFVYFWAFVYYMLRFRGKFDIILDCENGIPFFTPLYARERIFLVIHHVHQEVFLTSLRRPFSDIALFLEMKVMPLVYRKIRVITVSESSRKDIIEHGISSLDPIVIYNGIDTKTFIPGEKSEKPLIVYVGRLKQYKNISTLIKAVERVKKTYPQVQCIIGGDGEESAQLKKMVRNAGLSDTVIFKGYLSESEKVALLQSAWIFVNPSLREGWGITTIEANACGTPVVASDVPGLKDSVQNEYNGYLVPFGNAQLFAERMIDLIQNKKRRRKMEQQATEWAGRFSWEYSADHFSRFMQMPEAPEQQIVPALKPLRTSGISYGKVRNYEK